MPKTTVAVVTALSPSQTTLSEYGYYLLRALGSKSSIRVVALVEDLEVEYPSIPGVEIVRAWRFDSKRNPVRLARAAHKVGADAVIFNAHFRSFGSSKLGASLGLTAPLVARLSRIPSITLLHNLVETVDLQAAGFGSSRVVEKLMRAAGTAITRVVLTSSMVVTTMPQYVEVLRSKYRARNVALTPHGALVIPDPPQPPPAQPVIMTFGKFGTYKKVESLIEAMRSLGRDNLRLVIAGTDSPNTPGYLAGVEREVGGADVEFSGYVSEDDVEGTFRNATLTVFPYTATTGSSGVLHQAGAYGCAPVLPRIGDLEALVLEEGYVGAFFDPHDTADLARAIASLLDDEQERATIAQHNYNVACALPLESVADWYLVHLGTLVHGQPAALLAQESRSEVS